MKRQMQLGALSAAVMGLWSGSYAHATGAQLGNGLDPEPPAPTLTPGTWQLGTTLTALGTFYNLHAVDADVPSLLKAIGERSHTHIIVSDDVHARLPYLGATQLELSALLKRIASATHLAVGKVGPDTYLIVNAPTITARVPLNIAPLNPPPYLIAPNPLSQRSAHPSWQPRTFNGMTYYMIPLTQSATATAKVPALKSPRTPAPLMPATRPAPTFQPRATNPGEITPVR